MSNNVSLIITVGSIIYIIFFIGYEFHLVKKISLLKEKGSYGQFKKHINRQLKWGLGGLMVGIQFFILWIFLYCSPPLYRNPSFNLIILAGAILEIVRGISQLAIYYRLKNRKQSEDELLKKLHGLNIPKEEYP